MIAVWQRWFQSSSFIDQGLCHCITFSPNKQAIAETLTVINNQPGVWGKIAAESGKSTMSKKKLHVFILLPTQSLWVKQPQANYFRFDRAQFFLGPTTSRRLTELTIPVNQSSHRYENTYQVWEVWVTYYWQQQKHDQLLLVLFHHLHYHHPAPLHCCHLLILQLLSV